MATSHESMDLKTSDKEPSESIQDAKTKRLTLRKGPFLFALLTGTCFLYFAYKVIIPFFSKNMDQSVAGKGTWVLFLRFLGIPGTGMEPIVFALFWGLALLLMILLVRESQGIEGRFLPLLLFLGIVSLLVSGYILHAREWQFRPAKWMTSELESRIPLVFQLFLAQTKGLGIAAIFLGGYLLQGLLLLICTRQLSRETWGKHLFRQIALSLFLFLALTVIFYQLWVGALPYRLDFIILVITPMLFLLCMTFATPTALERLQYDEEATTSTSHPKKTEKSQKGEWSYDDNVEDYWIIDPQKVRKRQQSLRALPWWILCSLLSLYHILYAASWQGAKELVQGKARAFKAGHGGFIKTLQTENLEVLLECILFGAFVMLLVGVGLYIQASLRLIGTEKRGMRHWLSATCAGLILMGGLVIMDGRIGGSFRLRYSAFQLQPDNSRFSGLTGIRQRGDTLSASLPFVMARNGSLSLLGKEVPWPRFSHALKRRALFKQGQMGMKKSFHHMRRRTRSAFRGISSQNQQIPLYVDSYATIGKLDEFARALYRAGHHRFVWLMKDGQGDELYQSKTVQSWFFPKALWELLYFRKQKTLGKRFHLYTTKKHRELYGSTSYYNSYRDLKVIFKDQGVQLQLGAQIVKRGCRLSRRILKEHYTFYRKDVEDSLDPLSKCIKKMKRYRYSNRLILSFVGSTGKQLTLISLQTFIYQMRSVLGISSIHWMVPTESQSLSQIKERCSKQHYRPDELGIKRLKLYIRVSRHQRIERSSILKNPFQSESMAFCILEGLHKLTFPREKAGTEDIYSFFIHIKKSHGKAYLDSMRTTPSHSRLGSRNNPSSQRSK